jgi:hypothetical protein
MITARGINLGRDFVRTNQIAGGESYDIEVAEMSELGMKGTVSANGWTTGLTRLHRRFNLAVGDKLQADFSNGKVVLTIPTEIRQRDGTTSVVAQLPGPDSGEVGDLQAQAPDVAPAANDETNLTVMSRFRMKHKHLEKLSPGMSMTGSPDTRVIYTSSLGCYPP